MASAPDIVVDMAEWTEVCREIAALISAGPVPTHILARIGALTLEPRGGYEFVQADPVQDGAHIIARPSGEVFAILATLRAHRAVRA